MPIDTMIPHGKPGVAAYASQTLGGPLEPRYGEGVPTTVPRTVSAGANLDLPIYSVVSVINGVISLSETGAAAGFASGTITFATTGPANGQETIIGGVTYTFVTALSEGPTVPNEIVRSDTPATVAARLADALNGVVGTNVSVGTVANPQVAAEVAAAVVTVTALSPGVEGNVVEFDVGTAANTTLAPADDSLGGGTADANIRPWGILAMPLVLDNGQSATVPFYREGHWESRVLNFHESYVSEEQKRRAFEGSHAPTIFVSTGKHGPDAINL